MKNAILIVCVVVVIVGAGSIAVANVNIETVHVGDPGNAGEWSGSDGGPDRICGAVDYVYSLPRDRSRAFRCFPMCIGLVRPGD